MPEVIQDVPFAKLRVPVQTTVGPFGYSPVTADKGAILQLLRQGSYVQLDRYFDGLERAALADIGKEYDFLDGMRAFHLRDTTLETPLIAWKDALPRSAHAHAAMATWYLSQAWEARGTGLGIAIGARRIELMEAHAKDGAQEALAALQLDRDHIVAYAELIRLSLLVGNRTENRQIVDAARRQLPQSYVIPRMYLYHLEPRWGGSHEEMDAFVNEVVTDSAKNPRLVTLRGVVLMDRASGKLDDDEEVRLITQALAYGPEPIYFLERAQAHLRRDDYLHGIEDVNQMLMARHQEPTAVHTHAVLVVSAAEYLRGDARAAALRQAKAELETNLPYDNEPADAKEWLTVIEGRLSHCPLDPKGCFATRPLAFGISAGWWAILAALAVILLYNGFRWVTGGYPVPVYIHVFAGIAATIVLYNLVQLYRRQGDMPWNYWLAILLAPLVVYIVAIGLGGATWANQKRKREGGMTG